MPNLLSPVTPADLHHFHHVVSQAVRVRTHFDLLIWLQGEMQYYLQHDIMVAAWGDFTTGDIRHDVISPLSAVRSHNANAEALLLLLQNLYQRWVTFNNSAYALNVGESGFALENVGLECALGSALKTMCSALVHGIRDERHGINCLYVTFSTKPSYSRVDLNMVGVVLPHIDAALRRVSHLPQQSLTQVQEVPLSLDTAMSANHNLSTREVEIMFWVALGKTNPEIGCILNISEFTVKNHMQRVFKKLDVINRAQAVSKFRELCA